MPMQQTIVDWDIRKFLDPKQLAFVYKLWAAKGFAGSLELYPGARKAVRDLKRHANIHFLTSHWDDSETWVHERTKWIVKHFGVTSKDITFSHTKCKTWGDIFVDDYVKNLNPWREQWAPDGLAYLWRQDYNVSMPWTGNVLHSWKELEAVCLNWEHFRDMQRILYEKKNDNVLCK